MIKTRGIPVNLTSPNLAPPKFDLLALCNVHPDVQDAIRVSIAAALNLKDDRFNKPVNVEHLVYIRHLFCTSFPERDAWLFQYMPNIKYLYLQRSPISSTRHFENMHQLKTLDLARTSVYDLSPLRHLNRLGYLNVEGTRVLHSEDIAEEYRDGGSWAQQRRDRRATEYEFRFAQALSDLLFTYCFDSAIEMAAELQVDIHLIELALDGLLYKVPLYVIDELMSFIDNLLSNDFPLSDESDWKGDLYSMPDVAFFAEKYFFDLEYFSTHIGDEDE